MADSACAPAGLAPRELRERFRAGEFVRPTSGLAPGFVQANLVILPRALAFDFLLFCQRNPKPCPLLEVVEAGSAEPRVMAPGADLRTDAPKYRVYRHGVLAGEPVDLAGLWSDDLVSFLIGCSFTFESALLEAGIPVRHIEQCSNVPMYVTSVPTVPAGTFHGPMVVSMRPVPAGAGGAGGPGHVAVSGGARRARAPRRSRGDRDSRHRAPGPRRPGGDSRRARCPCSGPAG